VAIGRDSKETGRLWTALPTRIGDGPSPDNVPAWMATAKPGRQSRAPIVRQGIEVRPLALMKFTDRAVAALRRPGFRLEITRERDVVIGYKHDSVAAVYYDTLPDGKNQVSVVTAAIDGRDAGRPLEEIQADMAAGRESSDWIYEVWRQSTSKEHFYFSAISPDQRFLLLGTDPHIPGALR